MNRKGVTYDVGRVLGLNWRPDFDPKVVHRELEIIKDVSSVSTRTPDFCGRWPAAMAGSAPEELSATSPFIHLSLTPMEVNLTRQAHSQVGQVESRMLQYVSPSEQRHLLELLLHCAQGLGAENR